QDGRRRGKAQQNEQRANHGIEMNDSFGHEPLRCESDNGALEISGDHPPEKNKIEQLRFAESRGWNQRQSTTLVNDEGSEEKTAEGEIGEIEPGIGGPSIE